MIRRISPPLIPALYGQKSSQPTEDFQYCIANLSRVLIGSKSTPFINAEVELGNQDYFANFSALNSLQNLQSLPLLGAFGTVSHQATHYPQRAYNQLHAG